MYSTSPSLEDPDKTVPLIDFLQYDHRTSVCSIVQSGVWCCLCIAVDLHCVLHKPVAPLFSHALEQLVAEGLREIKVTNEVYNYYEIQ